MFGLGTTFSRHAFYGILYAAIFGLLYVIFRRIDDSNKCEMTYMWRQMHFMGLNFNDSDRYSLFLYGEGKYAAEFLQNEVVTGLPIIFVPGNAGSGRQIRSLGSVLQNKTDLRHTNFHFDTFAVDFNEELTGLSSEYFVGQARFLANAIEYVWNLYAVKPPGIVLIGHSMGGIVIQSLLLDAQFLGKEKISLVLSFATPFSEPPFLFDSGFFLLWKRLHALNVENNFLGRLISVSGGLKDEFIDEDWTYYGDDFLHVSTVSMDRVWLEADHNCLIWCNQLMRQTSRMLFDYAENQVEFFENPPLFLRRHYGGIGKRLQEIPPNYTRITVEECNLKSLPINGSGIIRHSSPTNPNEKLFLVAISRQLTTDLVEVNCLEEREKSESITRFLTTDRLFAFTQISQLFARDEICVNFEETSIWILKEANIFLPIKSLSLTEMFDGGEIKFRVENGLKILPLVFRDDWNSIVYKITYQRHSCKALDNFSAHRAIFHHKNSTRLSETNVNGAHFINVYKFGWDEPFAQLHFYDELNCEYSVKFEVERHYTLVKALRLYRHLIPGTVVISTLLLHFFTYSCNLNKFSGCIKCFALILLFPLIGFALRNFAEPTVILLSVNVTAMLFLNGVVAFVKPLLTFFGRKFTLSRLNLHEKLVLLFMLAFIAGIWHSIFIAIVCGVLNLFLIHSTGIKRRESDQHALYILQFLVLIFQAPSAIAYFWNVRMYGDFRSLNDYFFKSNAMVFLLSLTSLISASPEYRCYSLRDKTSKKKSDDKLDFLYHSAALFSGIFVHFWFISIFLVVYKNPFYFYQMLDDLCLICVSILGIFVGNGSYI